MESYWLRVWPKTKSAVLHKHSVVPTPECDPLRQDKMVRCGFDTAMAAVDYADRWGWEAEYCHLCFPEHYPDKPYSYIGRRQSLGRSRKT